MTENWVINASPLILLGKSGQLEWLPELGRVLIPKAVAAEVAAGSPDDPARQWLSESIGAALVEPTVPATDELLAWDLGHGETAVIACGMAHAGYEAILDDAAARRCGQVFGIALRGTLSLVALAKKRGLVVACRPVFTRMRAAGLFVTPALVEQVARSAGE